VRYLLGILVFVFALSWMLLDAFGWALFVATVTLVAGGILGSSLVLDEGDL
jgi:hypothetical protein